MSGTVVIEDEETPVSGARIDLVEGPDLGRTVQAGKDGRYLLPSLQEGTHEIRASAEGLDEQRRSVSLTSDQTVDFSLRRPATPPGPPPQPVQTFSGTLVEGISEGAVAGATLEVDGLGVFTTEGNGTFRIEVADPESIRTVSISSSAIVPRTTHLRIPGPDAQLTVIPGGFDLAAFDQMFRGAGRLQRWVSAPRLSVQTTVLQFTDVTAQDYVATDSVMTDDEVELLSEDLGWGLPLLTDGRIAFASQERETAESGASVRVARPGEIVVARYSGLQAATGFWGYGRWASDGAGRIQGGIVMLDAGFDSSGSEFRRSLRVHELGHALGYNHVTKRQSVMNASARFEPNEFDLHGARIAFLRPPGNRSPDLDPDEFTSNLVTGVLIWSGDR